jgi:hypothetical protein
VRGRSEATSLGRCRAQIQHRGRDGRRIRRGAARCSDGAQKRGTTVSTAVAGSVASLRAERVRLCDQDFPHERDRIVRKICAPFRARMWTRFAAMPGPTTDAQTTDTGHRQPWRERPLRSRGGPFPARAPGPPTPWFPALIAAPGPAQWAAKSAVHRACVARSRCNVRPDNRLSAVLSGVPSPA